MLTPCEIVFRLNGGGAVGGIGARRVRRRHFRRERQAERVVAQVEAELLGPLAIDLEDLDVDDDLGARLVVRSMICSMTSTTAPCARTVIVFAVLFGNIAGCTGSLGCA